MDYDEFRHRRNQSNPQAIPLQDLGQPEADHLSAPDRGHRRSLSERGRDFFQQSRNSLLQRDRHAPRYAPVGERRRRDSQAGIGLGLALDTNLTSDGQQGISPTTLETMGAAGIFIPRISDNHHLESPTRRAWRAGTLPTLRTVAPDDDDEMRSLMDVEEYGDGTGAFPSENDADTMPLTVSTNPSYSSPARGHTPLRSGTRKYLSPSRTEGHDPEMGTSLSPSMGDNARSRSNSSLTPTSPIETPLRRAGTILEKMSQRVVNLSNDADVVEKNIKRSPSMSHGGHSSHHTTPVLPGSLDGQEPGRSSSVVEKTPSPVQTYNLPNLPERPTKEPNPLRGKSLNFFEPENRLRKFLLEVLTNPLVEPTILVLIVAQTVLLALESATSVWADPRSATWGGTYTDFAILGLFIVYTLEVIAKIIVSGFLINPIEYSTINREIGFRHAVMSKASNMFSIHHKATPADPEHVPPEQPQPFIRSFTFHDVDETPKTTRQARRKRLARRAFLRHSFNRLDFLAVVSYWISFWIAVFGQQSKQHLYVFLMLSCLRILRLLGITSGTLVILRSLKRAMPELLNVAVLIGFFWLLFAIVGVQSFKSSLRRTCTWNSTSPATQANYTQNYLGNFQFCGGWLAPNGTAMPYLSADGTFAEETAKGFWCPVGSFCMEGDNPYNGTVHFDNLPHSMEMIFVIMTSNTFSDIMYYLTNSDYTAAALFYALGIVMLALWLVNLLVAVITASFQIIREESKASAFAAEQTGEKPPEKTHDTPAARPNALKRSFERTHWFWISVIAFGLVSQMLRSATMGPGRAAFIIVAEIGVTLTLDVEIVLRLVTDWRNFFKVRSNLVDLTLAIATSVIQLPVIRHSGQTYAWLSVFQILRVYRIVLAIKVTRELIMLILGNVFGLANLILFVFLLGFLAAIFASQLFRGVIPILGANGYGIQVTFFNIWNSFLGMWQIFSSENWTLILYDVTSYQSDLGNGWIGAGFCILWYILANFVMLNMFIALIQENFDVSEDQKRLHQVKAFLLQKRLVGSTAGVLSLSAIFKFGNAKRQDPLDFGSATTEMLLKDAVVKDFLEDPSDSPEGSPHRTPALASTEPIDDSKIMTSVPGARLWQRLTRKLFDREPNPFFSGLEAPSASQEFDPRAMAKQVVLEASRRRQAQKDYLQKHPNYLTSMFIFKPGNPIRKMCQKTVGPGRGAVRVEGPMPSAPVWYAFSAFIYAAIVAMVILACITTPLYQKQYFEKHGFITDNWFMWTDLGFASLFTVEAVIKVIADGFFWTPNAYFRSSWGIIDAIVLITLWVNVLALLASPGSGSRALGAFKALRALRLLNISDSARDTFHSVIVVGGWKVVSAALVSLSLLVPFAIYGLNLFNGQMMYCNDNQTHDIYNLTDCMGEYESSPYNWEVLAPRQVTNNYYSFDDFGSALFILFQIVSQEGWVDVMWSGQSITGIFTQYLPFSRQGNAVFFVIFNLLGSVFVVTLFVSVFMRNYTETTGVAFLTIEQRAWLELRKLLRQVTPSKRPNLKKRRFTWQDWCYKQSVKKNGRWQRSITALLILHLILLCLEWYPDDSPWLEIRDYIFLVLTVILLVHIVISIIGRSWQRFRRSAWDMFALLAVTGTLAFTILLFTDRTRKIYIQSHKIFLVSIALLLIPRNNQLDHLFKTAAASLTSISNLLATWFVMFLVFAIAMNQTFGLTRFGPNESVNINFRDVPNALILLFRMSVGEGWNQTMVDFARIMYPYCTEGARYYDGDCGSESWARALFVLWNIISMYIFVSLFVSLIFESFSYVFERSSGLSVISREEIRRFKQAWAEFDPDGTGYISKELFPRLLGELSGVFEMRIYDGDFTVGSILDDCRVNTNRYSSRSLDLQSGHLGIDLQKLNERLRDLPVEEIRRRRHRMNIFYEEVLVSADSDKGIEFTALLMILSHYKVINDNRSLRLEEFLRRRARLQRVEEAVRRNVVVGFFDTLYWSRRFRAKVRARKHESRLTTVPSHEYAVPEIFVQDESMDAQALQQPGTNPSTPLLQVSGPDGEGDRAWEHFPATPATGSSGRSQGQVSSHGVTLWDTPSTGARSRADSNVSPLARGRANSNISPHASPTLRTRTLHSAAHGLAPDTGPWHLAASLAEDPLAPSQGDGAGGERLNRSGSTASVRYPTRPERAVSTSRPGEGLMPEGGAGGGGGRSRAATVSHQGLMDVLDNSVWGESIRRSFTTRRTGSASHGDSDGGGGRLLHSVRDASGSRSRSRSRSRGGEEPL